MQIPVLSALPRAGFIAAPGASKPITQTSWTSMYIQAEEIAAVMPLPRAYLDDARFNIWGEVRPRLAEAIAQTIDEAILIGQGAPASFPPGGVLALAGPPIAAQPPPQQPDIVQAISDAMAAIEDTGLECDGFAARSTVRGAMRNVRTTTGDFLVWAPNEPGAPSTMYGVPLAYTKIGFSNRPVDLIAGDWSALIIGMREDMRFDISEEGTLYNADGTVYVSAFQDDVAIMRVYMRLGVSIGRPVIKLPDGTDGPGNPFAAVRAPQGGGPPLEVTAATSGKTATASVATK
jgi:HK97 family phage major capsid protein